MGKFAWLLCVGALFVACSGGGGGPGAEPVGDAGAGGEAQPAGGHAAAGSSSGEGGSIVATAGETSAGGDAGAGLGGGGNETAGQAGESTGDGAASGGLGGNVAGTGGVSSGGGGAAGQSGAAGSGGMSGAGPVHGGRYWSYYCNRPTDGYSCVGLQPAAQYLWSCGQNVAPPDGNFCQETKKQPTAAGESVWCCKECMPDPSFDFGTGDQYACPASNPKYYSCTDGWGLLGGCITSWATPGGVGVPIESGGRCCAN